MAELVDALDSKSCSFGSAGSIPASGTKEETFSRESPFFVLKLCKALLLLKINAAPSFNQGYILPSQYGHHVVYNKKLNAIIVVQMFP